MTSRPVVAVEARAGFITTEIAELLADSLERRGLRVVFRADDAEPSEPTADVVVLVGGGPEFGSVARLLADYPRHQTVAFWSVDPLPPPGLSRETRQRGLRMAGADARLRLPDTPLGASARSLLPKRVRARFAEVRARFAGAHRSLVDRGDEALLPHADRQAFRRLRWIDENVAAARVHYVVTATEPARQVLSEHGITASYMPVGWHPRMGFNLDGVRDVDVLFLGRTGGERGARLQRLVEELTRRGITLATPRSVTPDERSVLLNRTRLLLNLRGTSWNPELPRFVLGAGCGALVVSEAPIPGTEPFVPGRHFVAAEPEHLPSVIERCLGDAGARRVFVAAAQDLVTTQVTMDAVATHFLELCSAAR